MFNKLKILTSSNFLSFLHMKDINFEEQVLLVNMFMLNCNFFVKLVSEYTYSVQLFTVHCTLFIDFVLQHYVRLLTIIS